MLLIVAAAALIPAAVTVTLWGKWDLTSGTTKNQSTAARASDRPAVMSGIIIALRQISPEVACGSHASHLECLARSGHDREPGEIGRRIMTLEMLNNYGLHLLYPSMLRGQANWSAYTTAVSPGSMCSKFALCCFCGTSACAHRPSGARHGDSLKGPQTWYGHRNEEVWQDALYPKVPPTALRDFRGHDDTSHSALLHLQLDGAYRPAPVAI